MKRPDRSLLDHGSGAPAPRRRFGRSGPRVAAIGWAVALAACLAVLAPGSIAVAQAAPPGTASITGTVTSHKTGADLSGIVVTATSETDETSSTTTTANGTYTIEELSAGSYSVEFYDPTNMYDEEYESVTLAEGEARTLNASLYQSDSIVGRVTNAAGAGLDGITVEADGYYYYATTNSNGEYRIEDVSLGTYEVDFVAYESAYLSQTVKVTVTEGENTVNAVLKEGGKITGSVTNAYSHAGLGKIDVYVHSPSTASAEAYFYGSATTNAAGEYTVVGIPTGSYVVDFYWEFSAAEEEACLHQARCPAPYIGQYYSNETSEATANLVAATEGAVTSAINAAMVPSVPTNTAAPAISGTPTVGSVLTCSNGSWTGETELQLSTGWPLTTPFSYQWLLEGGPIAGANSSAFVVESADVGHGLACEVTATNIAGHAAARSATVAVTLPSIAVTGTKLKVSDSKTALPLECANATCAGTIELKAKTVVKRAHGKKKTTTTKKKAVVIAKKTVVIATAKYSLAAGQKAAVALRLTAAGKSALKAAAHGKLSATATVTVTGGSTVTKAVQLSGPAPKVKKHKKSGSKTKKKHKATGK